MHSPQTSIGSTSCTPASEMMRAEASVDTHNSVLKDVKRKKVLMGADDGVNYNEF